MPADGQERQSIMTSPGPGGSAGDINQLFSGSPTLPDVTGGVFIGAPDLALPPAADPFIDAATHSPLLKNVGFVSEDGVTGTEDRSINEVVAWGGDIIAYLQESFSVEWQMKLLQIMNADIARLAYGDDNVAVTEATAAHGNWLAIKVNKNALPKKTVWVDSFYADGSEGVKRMRWVAPRAQVSEKGDFQTVHTDISGHELTLKLLPDAAGNNAYIYLDDGQVVALPAPTSWTATLTGPPTAGTFTLTVGGQTTSGIAYNATVPAVQSALTSLSTVGAGNATVTGSAGGPYSVTLTQGGTLTGSGSGLTGGDITVVAA